MDLDPRYLETFATVGRERSFSRAARTLHKTQPAVSYQIRRLEEQLGAALIDRTTRGVTLTAAGAELFSLCEHFFDEFGRLAASLRDPAAAPQRPLRIASVSGFGRYVLFPRLAASPPTARYSLRYPTVDEILRSLDDGTCDLGFVYRPLVANRLTSVPVWREELVLIAPRTPPARLPRRIDAFERQPFVTYDESEYVFGAWFERAYGAQPRSLPASHHFEELEEVISTVAAGRGWSIVPDHSTAPFARRLSILRRPRRPVLNTIYAVSRAGAPPHAAAATLIASLQAAPRYVKVGASIP